MARKNNDAEAFATIVGLAIIGVIYNVFLQIKLFYEQNQILFWLITVVLIIGIVALSVFVENLRNKKWLAIEKIEDMQKLHWREFEEFIEFVLEKKGFKTKLGRGIKDGGVDIEANLDGRKYLVQCKKWNKYKVSEPNIREFLGAISDFDIDAKGIYVTTSRLTSDATIFAERNDIAIWDEFSLEGYVAEFTGKEVEKPKQIQAESNKKEIICAKCGGKLVKRIAKQGVNKGNEFLGCENYPQCKNIVNL